MCGIGCGPYGSIGGCNRPPQLDLPQPSDARMAQRPELCTREWTCFCAVSSFLAFPGLPVYARTNLINWRLASYAWTRLDQLDLPDTARDVDYQQGEFFAPTLRYRSCQFHMTCTCLGAVTFQWMMGTTLTKTILLTAMLGPMQ